MQYMTPAEAVRLVRSGDTIVAQGSTSVPNVLFRALTERAAELRKILAETGHLYPKDFWPWLQYLSTWKCGNT